MLFRSVGEVGFSVATVASISLGIVVDDTVHLLSKYVRARAERGGTAADAIRYAFKNVGVPPDGGAVFFLAQHLGVAKAKELVYTARRLPAAEVTLIALLEERTGPLELPTMDDIEAAAGPN